MDCWPSGPECMASTALPRLPTIVRPARQMGERRQIWPADLSLRLVRAFVATRGRIVVGLSVDPGPRTTVKPICASLCKRRTCLDVAGSTDSRLADHVCSSGDGAPPALQSAGQPAGMASSLRFGCAPARLYLLPICLSRWITNRENRLCTLSRPASGSREHCRHSGK